MLSSVGVLSKPKVGLVFSSGGARGAAHVGVLKVLEENGIVPDVIAGASMGAEIGGAYAAGLSLDEMESHWRSASFVRAFRMLLPTIPWSGWSSGREIVRFLNRLLGDRRIEDLPTPFAAVATDLEAGCAVPIRRGSLVAAIRASLSVPGLFTPVWIDGRLLIDGGVSNPLPVDVARDLGADVVIAVDVLVDPAEVRLGGIPARGDENLGIVRTVGAPGANARRYHPSVFSVLFQMSTVFQKRLANLIIENHAPDVLIRPDFSEDPPTYADVGCAIEAGEHAARAALPEIRRLSSAEAR
jgi:NTE family protein